MLAVLLIIVGVVVVLFGMVVLFGPPYLPTLRKQIDSALDLLDLQPGQTLLELGSGDGRVVAAAAARGLRVVGIELNPLLVIYSRLITWRYRKRVTIIWGNVWTVKWPPKTDAIFTFMLQRQMSRLDAKVVAWHTEQSTKKSLHMASFAFYIPDKKPIAERDGVFLYEY